MPKQLMRRRTMPAKLAKIRAGVYKHPSGRLIVKTYEWEGPCGGNLSRWEHASSEGDDVVLDGSTFYKTLREAAVAVAQDD